VKRLGFRHGTVGARRGLTGLLSIAAVAGLALATTGCNVKWGPYAARVDNTDITPATLDAAMSALKADPGFVCLEFGTTFKATGAGEHTYDLKSADFVLNQLIEYRIERQMASSLGATPPASATSLASVQLTNRLDSQLSSQTTATCPKTGADLSKLGAAYKNVAVGLLSTEDAIAAHLAGTSLSTASLARYEAGHRSTTSETCVSIIEVPSKSTAAAIALAVKHGASFAQEAVAHSIDTASAKQGGALGCTPSISALGSYAKPVEALAVNQVTAPLAYTSGGSSAWLLFTVTSRPAEPTAVLVEQLLSTEQTPFVSAVKHAISRARVSLSSQYGSWRDVGEIVPPSTAASRYAPDPTAVLGPALSSAVSPAAPGSSAAGG
jgi:hypothetical protein